jgi:Low-density lipoprotein receptor repeat class B
MFWSDWGAKPRIETARMDGSERRTLVDKMVQWPTGLAIDYPARRLYWTDPKALTVSSVDLEGKDRHLVKKFTPGRCLEIFFLGLFCNVRILQRTNHSRSRFSRTPSTSALTGATIF